LERKGIEPSASDVLTMNHGCESQSIGAEKGQANSTLVLELGKLILMLSHGMHIQIIQVVGQGSCVKGQVIRAPINWPTGLVIFWR